MDGVVVGKASAQIPGSTTPASEPLLAIKLAARSNHPLGTAHPHIIKIGGFFQQMIRHLDNNSEDYNYLGAQTYLGVERATANEVIVMIYFKDYAGLYKFAHTAQVHKTAWRYWNKEGMKNPVAGRQFAIMHETLQVPARSWESIYINYHRTDIGATTFFCANKFERRYSPDTMGQPVCRCQQRCVEHEQGSHGSEQRR